MNIKEVLEAQDREDVEFENEDNERKRLDAVKRDWTCRKCGADYLRLMLVQRPDGVFYFRLCPACKNRTRLQPFKDTVKGQETKL
jgi:DNA-directed RNA polymerase subunit M/transcription elongation factor TFIIS